MINLLVAYDNIDPALGQYLAACFADLQGHLDLLHERNLICISGAECNQDQIETHTTSFSGNKFIFIGLSHGNKKSLLASHNEYVNFGNASRFENALFYTCACLTAVELGPELERIGCLAYIGYNREVTIVNRFESVFKACKTSGIKSFLSGDKTIGEAYQDMISTYESECDTLGQLPGDSFLAAALLRGNMLSLVCLGDTTLTLNDFQLLQ